ncbi:MAG: hypothetical protein QXN08_00085 [Nitrososphaerales archaeon]
MSIKVLGRILLELGIELTELSKRELYAELARNFSFIGSYRECERLEEMWSDPVYKKAVEEYIKAWLEFRRKKRVVEAYT